MAARTEFVYLSESDTIEAGVLDAERCIEVCDEVFRLLATGDYLMGGANHNSHGLGLVFPKEPPFPNMPAAGPDRRFVAMPAYLGGRFDVCGNKWYGSNAANSAKGLPRSVLTLMLNDKDTGEPLAVMSANLVSAARTGAIPATAARYLAQTDDAEVVTVIGCGPINRACYRAIVTQLPSAKRVVTFDLYEEKAQEFATWSEDELGIPGAAARTLEEAVAGGDVITVAASRLAPLKVLSSWFKPGATVLVSGPLLGDDAFWLDSRIVFDHVGLHEAYVEDAVLSGDKEAYYSGVIGGPLYRLIDQGALPPLAESADLGNVILRNQSGRGSDEERVVFIASGMAVFDVAWGQEILSNSLARNIGRRLVLWDKPHLQ